MAVDQHRSQSYNRHNRRIASPRGTVCSKLIRIANPGKECCVVEEYPNRSSVLGDIEQSPLTDDYDGGRNGANAVRQGASDEGARNRFDMRNHYEVAMNTGTNVNLRKLQEQLDRQPLDEIAMLVQALTYGEMIELAEGMWKVQPEGAAVTQENLPALLHRWSKSRSSLPAEEAHQESSAP
jgi:hypothetical protein